MIYSKDDPFVIREETDTLCGIIAYQYHDEGDDQPSWTVEVIDGGRVAEEISLTTQQWVKFAHVLLSSEINRRVRERQ